MEMEQVLTRLSELEAKLEKQDEIIEALKEKIISLQKDVAKLNADAIKLNELVSNISSEFLPLVPPSTVHTLSPTKVPPLPSPLPSPPPSFPPSFPSTTIPWTLADEESLTKRENAISHLQLCIARRNQCEIDLITFRRKYSETVINADPILHSRHIELIIARKEAWEAYFKAYDALYPKTIEDILWIMAKAGHTQLVAPR